MAVLRNDDLPRRTCPNPSDRIGCLMGSRRDWIHEVHHPPAHISDPFPEDPTLLVDPDQDPDQDQDLQ